MKEQFPTNSVYSFTKTDTLFFKGIGILMIVLHNYYHSLLGFGIENEFLFDSQNYLRFYSKIAEGNLAEMVSSLFSFLGHYGVQIFFFFSAYGLTKQYPKWKEKIFPFVLNRLKKVYFLMLFGVIVTIAILEISGISFGTIGTLIRTLILGSTLNSFTTISMIIGPFWFFAAIIQFYILFPFLYRFVTRFKENNYYLPVAISLVLVYFLYFTVDGFPMELAGESFSLSVFRNVIGHLPELILGISMAHFNIRSFSKITLLVAFAIFIGSQISSVLFPLSFISITILMIPFFYKLESVTPALVKRAIHYIGSVSMILFVVNGAYRSMVKPNMEWGKTAFYLISLFLLSHLLFLLYNYLIKTLKI